MRDSGKVQVRQELLDRLRTELVGPEDEDEILPESPTTRYLTGILWPQNTAMSEVEEQDNIENINQSGQDPENPDQTAPLMGTMLPSSMGLSFLVKKNSPKIQVEVEWGTYTKMEDKGEDTEPNRNSPRWQRKQWRETVYLNLLDGMNKGRQEKTLVFDKYMSLEWLARDFSDFIAVSLFLVNRKKAGDPVLPSQKDELCVFQPVITVRGNDQDPYPFCERKMDNNALAFLTEDQLSDNLLYRDNRVFATGHGTAVEWDSLSEDGRHAGLLKTVTIPSHEVPMVLPPAWDGEGSMDMKELAEAENGNALKNMLEPLCNKYEQWIAQQERHLEKIEPGLRKTAEKHLEHCRHTLQRMKKGLSLIVSQEKAFTAFKFANRAMFMQRVQSARMQEARKKNDWSRMNDIVAPAKWRPFQMAFILQGLTGIVNPTDEDRQIADLLWFPTGGGKTEAYLGLAAFTMAYRRLCGDRNGKRGDAGVTVLMRYTLRLLTIQQFQRAATLICAMELLRKESEELYGETPFRIGLWVGGASTPNSFDDTVKFMKKLKNGESTEGMPSPIQLVSCPWCGTSLIDKNNPGKIHHSYYANKKRRRLEIYCTRKECEFSRSNNWDGLPVVVSDEEIYRLAPSMLIGTVDKFARLPWVGDTQVLFGKVQAEIEHWGFLAEGAERDTTEYMREVLNELNVRKNVLDSRQLLPPELIIQDELHLISGPLGSMVGLYETALDSLCMQNIYGKTVGPKIVSSTATIRRAKEQVRSLFNRRLSVFPGPGLTSGDSFFAKEQPVDKQPGRLYVGIFAPGRSMKTALVRIYATLLASTPAMDYPYEDLDPYYTLVGYFNSLRELGGAVRLVEDDVRSRMQVLKKRPEGRFSYKFRSYENDVPELTSRINSKDIPDILASLETPYKGPDSNPVDIVLASNMISVGVDVPRLGLMVVTGQPKTTAEYIQSTSRVGRASPGLVITLYNWARPRDVSHYEEFSAYHASLYRYVEAISVTPFASRALDRGLAGTLFSMCRLGIPQLAKMEDAKNVGNVAREVKEMKNYLLNRVRSVEEENQRLINDVKRETEKVLDDWEKAAEYSPHLYYRHKDEEKSLMRPLGTKTGGKFKVPNSMRSVEPSIGIYLKGDQ